MYKILQVVQNKTFMCLSHRTSAPYSVTGTEGKVSSHEYGFYVGSVEPLSANYWVAVRELKLSCHDDLLYRSVICQHLPNYPFRHPKYHETIRP